MWMRVFGLFGTGVLAERDGDDDGAYSIRRRIS